MALTAKTANPIDDSKKITAEHPLTRNLNPHQFPVHVTPEPGTIEAPGHTGTYISAEHPLAKAINKTRTLKNFASVARGEKPGMHRLHEASALMSFGTGVANAQMESES